MDLLLYLADHAEQGDAVARLIPDHYVERAERVHVGVLVPNALPPMPFSTSASSSVCTPSR